MKRLCCTLLSLSLLVFATGARAAEKIAPEYFEKVASLLEHYGAFESWPLTPKMAWVSMLCTYSTDETVIRSAEALLDVSMPDVEREAGTTKLLLSLYGNGNPAGMLNLYNCMEGELGNAALWSPEERALFSGLNLKYFPEMWDVLIHCIPDASAIPPSEAIEIAKQEIAAAEGLADHYDWGQFHVAISYGVLRANAPDRDPWYIIEFMRPVETDADQLPYAYAFGCWVSKEGRVMDRSDFDFTPSPAESRAEREDIPTVQTFFADAPDLSAFSAWSLEEKADFSEEWRPAVQAYLLENPDYKGVYFLATQHAYGMPAPTMVSQEKAKALAEEALLQKAKVTQEELDRCEARYYFDITDETKPVWKVYLSTTFSFNYQDGDSWGHFVVLDAATGEIVTITARTLDASAMAFY